MDKKTTSGLVQLNGKGKTRGSRNIHRREVKKGRKGSQILPSKKYPLRSADSSRGRVLRSNSKENNKAPSEQVNNNVTVQSAEKKRKRGRPSKGGSPKSEYFRIRQRVRYILNRMSYEQSLIQAYASEGWKGQSLEKIRPEKELERARAEILRCKLRIREAFQNLDSLLAEGKLDESLFDSKGEISSEDIFCAICGSKHVTLKNDIILCDGACDRGFHQNCLNPPLRAEDIPAGDEGWLCPACDCKLDCIDVLNELQGSILSIHDSWEKVFPEAAAHANGSKQIDASDLPSDDSDDNDFKPDLAEGNMLGEDKSSSEDGGEGSDSDELDFITSSENSEPSKKRKSKSSSNKTIVDDLGLPSEDSEDDDFDPAGPGSSEDQKDESKSDDESDFTSDSDDFCTEITKSHGQDDVSAPSLSDAKTVDHLINEMQISVGGKWPNAEVSYTELEQDMVLPVSSRRQVERLDYKKLYDEAYGKEQSDSADDEEWSGNSTPQTGNLEDSETDSLSDFIHPTKSWSRRAAAGLQNKEHTPQRHSLGGSASVQQTEILYSNGSSSTARKRHFGPIINQKLKEFFKEDPYPSRATKESLAQELGLTFHQVTKWFASTRHYSRVAAVKNDKDIENHTAENNVRGAISKRPGEPNDSLVEEFSVDRNDMVSEERMTQNNIIEGKNGDVISEDKTAQSNIVEGNNGDSLFRQGISCQQRVAVTPFVNHNCPTNSIEVGSPKGGIGTSRNVGSPGGKSAENNIPGLEFVDAARKKAILRELRKRKTGR